MLHVAGDTLLSSDWHVLHRNIYWFLPKERAALSGAKNPKALSAEEFLAAERETYRRLLAELRETLANRPIRRFVFLGDLVFGLNRGGGASKLVATLRRELAVFFEFFSLLREHGVQRYLILGNHDHYRSSGGAARSLYEELFDDVALYIEEPGRLYTHFPVGYSRPAEALRGTPDEKYYRMNKVFAKLDKRLLAELGDGVLTNYHGHLHAGPFAFPVKNVAYENVALDMHALSADGLAPPRVE